MAVVRTFEVGTILVPYYRGISSGRTVCGVYQAGFEFECRRGLPTILPEAFLYFPASRCLEVPQIMARWRPPACFQIYCSRVILMSDVVTAGQCVASMIPEDDTALKKLHLVAEPFLYYGSS